MKMPKKVLEEIDLPEGGDVLFLVDRNGKVHVVSGERQVQLVE
jgi:antitoxin component of MazEF toxin-antitoxin module